MLSEFHVTELLPAYVLGSLDPDETRQVKIHLSGCAHCQVELRLNQEIVDDLPLAIEEVEPPVGLQKQLMKRIQKTDSAAIAPVQMSRWEQLTAAVHQNRTFAFSQIALLLIVAILLISSLLLWQQLSRSEPSPDLGRMQAIQLKGTDLIPDAVGYLIISYDGLSGAIILDRLPELGEDQRYQLWLIKDGERTGGALLSVDELGYGGNRVRAPESLFNYSWAEVTIEPADGSVQPNGEVILEAELFP
jgi:anti-sigma-K factor RskA